MKQTHDFDKYLLIPQYSILDSRDDCSVKTKLTNNISLDIPIVSSPMNTVTELDMCMSMNRLGGLGVLHRYMPPKDQSEIMQNVAGPRAASIGVNGDTKERINNLINEGVSLLVFDVAH